MASVAIALHQYPAENETEMTLVEGQEYEILEKNESGWWHVSNGSDTGWAPSNYLKEAGMPSDPSSPPPMEAEPVQAAPMQMNGAQQPPAPPSNGGPGGSADVRSALDQIKEIQKAKTCKTCNKDIVGEFVMAKGAHFCVACFACTQCGSSLAGKGYVEREGAHYCENCYHDKFSPHCARCNKVIRGQYISALDQTWCPGCFSCTSCSSPFESDQFRKRNNKPYCEKCYQQNFAVSCEKCGNVIQGKAFNAQDKNYHQECFVCVKGCAISETDSFHVRDGQIYCRNCYRSEFVKICHRCGKDISGKYICVLEKYFHDECWTCQKCNRSMMDGEFRQVGDDFQCSDCAPSIPGGQQNSQVIDERPPPVPISSGGTQAQQAPQDGGPPPPNPYSNGSPSSPPPTKRVNSASAGRGFGGGGGGGGSATPSRSLAFASSTPRSQPYATPQGMEYVVGEDNSYMQSQKEQDEPQVIETCYSYAQLKSGDTLPKGIDRSQLQKYLSDREFKEVFKMRPGDFDSLAPWKKNSLKKKAGIF